MRASKGQYGSNPQAEKALQDMIGVIHTLEDVYKKETDALESMNTKAFLGLQDRKLEAAHAYQERLKELLENKDNIKSAPQHLKKKLETMQQDFAELSRKNMDALQRMKRCTERLGETIHQAARDAAEREQNRNYGECGRVQKNEKKSISMGVSETA